MCLSILWLFSHWTTRYPLTGAPYDGCLVGLSLALQDGLVMSALTKEREEHFSRASYCDLQSTSCPACHLKQCTAYIWRLAEFKCEGQRWSVGTHCPVSCLRAPRYHVDTGRTVLWLALAFWRRAEWLEGVVRAVVAAATNRDRQGALITQCCRARLPQAA